MNALTPVASPRFSSPFLLAAEPGAEWEARGLTDLVPSATLGEARSRRDELAALLSRERAAAADFLLALADFDRRRGWERLGHPSLFAFLTSELGLSNGAAQLRLSAARLLPRHPAVEAALRSGRLCLSAVGQLARVLTPENEAEVLPRFLGLSARDAQGVAAALLPYPAPPRREVVTAMPRGPVPASAPCLERPSLPADDRAATAPLHAPEVQPAARVPMPPAQVEPLTADLRRLHLTVSSRLLEKVAKAKAGLSHTRPGSTTEEVLEAALDLLLEKQARRKALVNRTRALSAPPSASPPAASPGPSPGVPQEEGARPVGPATPPRRPPIPAAIAREVRLRDGDRCQFPLDAGGVCGSTWQVELDHVEPLALGGATTAANLRCCCRVHNRMAAEAILGLAASTRRL